MTLSGFFQKIDRQSGRFLNLLIQLYKIVAHHLSFFSIAATAHGILPSASMILTFL